VYVLVILRYALSAKNRRRKEAKIASLCRVLSLGVRPPDEQRVDIDVHSGWVIGGVILLFSREMVTSDALHCYHQRTPKDKTRA